MNDSNINDNNINGNNSNSNVNNILYEFMVEESIWEIIGHLEEKCCNHRYIGYLELMGLMTMKDVESLDKIARTGYALYLAEQLVGSKCFWATIAESIRHAIKLDTQDSDLAESEAKKLLGLLQAAL